MAIRVRTNPGSKKGLMVKWKAVNLPDAQPMYRLFIEWEHEGKVHVSLLYEGKETSGVIRGRLPTPHRMYVSVVVKKKRFEHQAGNIVNYPTKQAVIPGTHFTPRIPGKC